MARLKKASERDHDMRALILRAQLLSDATQKVLKSIGECFTFDMSIEDLVDLHKLHDTNEDFEIELRHYYIDSVSKKWEPDHSLESRYRP
jgi:hypothetical protein